MTEMTNEERAEIILNDYLFGNNDHSPTWLKGTILIHLNAACEQVKAEAVKAERERVLEYLDDLAEDPAETIKHDAEMNYGRKFMTGVEAACKTIKQAIEGGE